MLVATKNSFRMNETTQSLNHDVIEP